MANNLKKGESEKLNCRLSLVVPVLRFKSFVLTVAFINDVFTIIPQSRFVGDDKSAMIIFSANCRSIVRANKLPQSAISAKPARKLDT